MGSSAPPPPPSLASVASDTMRSDADRASRRGSHSTTTFSLDSVGSSCRGTAARHANVHVQRTDVIVIGNGPSGICLSYMLSGNWPYIVGTGHPNEMLAARLQYLDRTKSLLLQDLQQLSDGLEGRTSNPVALLFDALSNPDADVGAQLPSLLRWKFHPERKISHVVLGRFDEGGVWQTVESRVQTLSLADWMQLPGLSFAEWRDKYWRERTSFMDINTTAYNSPRATAAEVRQYYSDYVASQQLRPNFVNHVMVTSVERVYDDCCRYQTDCESGEDVQCSVEMSRPITWEVRGYRVFEGRGDESGKEEFCYRAPAVVLATGTFSVPNALHVPGETQPFVLHSVTELDERIQRGDLRVLRDPVVVIGAGLSAADAILRVRAEGIPVVHVFRQSAGDHLSIYRQLPAAVYPEYDLVHRLMCSGVSDAVHGYSSYPNATVVDFTSNNEVLLQCDDIKGEVVIRASLAAVLIGSRPNLSFLQGEEMEIGTVPGVAVDSKHNPIDVDSWTYESHKHSGLYAVGPLAGDSFVRFLRGGALGVTAHLWQQRENDAPLSDGLHEVNNSSKTEIMCC